jgi:vancomycin resistance protein YoaR
MRSSYTPTQPVYVYHPPAVPRWWARALIAFAIGLLLFALLLPLLPAYFNNKYAGRIYPGVSVGGIDLSGLRPEQAMTLLAQKMDYPERGRVVFTEGANTWIAKPGDVGLYFDFEPSVQTAYQVGRKGSILSRLSNQYQAWRDGIDLTPWLVYDEAKARDYLKAIITQIEKPVIEASLTMDGINVVVNSGQVGQSVDLPAALMQLQAQLPTLTDGIIPLTVHETSPVILDASAQAEIARKILSAPLVISVPNSEPGDPGPWTFDQKTLASMLTIEKVNAADGTRYQVSINSTNLRAFLEGIAPNFLRYPQNARFTFNDDTRQLEVIQHAVSGRNLDVDASLQSIVDKVSAGEHNLSLVIPQTQPEAPDDITAEKLGITENVVSYTSYFRGSGAERIQNIKIASAQFHGLLVAPGQTFSMASALGDVSLDNGYAEALIIFGDRTIKGVGGGVCQVSTTLFRTVFFGGYPVGERYAHAYRVGYYEQTANGYDQSLAGLDATVFAPVVDFTFTNDTPYWLLMETYVSASNGTLTWKFYSTSDGRSVEWQTSGPLNIVKPPEPSYEENPELSQGTIKQVDWAADGSDVRVTRTVWRDGNVITDDVFTTHYLPWQAKYQYGPGTEGIPTPEPDATPTPEP